MANDLKKIFFTSDWHIGHANVILFDNRPFKDLDHMHRVLINNFNACVPSNGLTYFLGDMGLRKSEALRKTIPQLNGTKVLILGNHDKGMNSMYNAGFDCVLNAAVLYIAQKRVTLAHCPMKGVFRENTASMERSDPSDNWHGEKKNGAFTVADEGQFHLHGHIHSRVGKETSQKILGKQWDIGVVANDYRPVSIGQIESWISLHSQGALNNRQQKEKE